MPKTKTKTKKTVEMCYFDKITLDNDFAAQIASTQNEFTEKEFPKLLQAAEVHGYRGPSKKKHNGVVPLRPSDTKLIKLYNKVIAQYPGIQAGLPVKVVAHVENIRLVGIRSPNDSATAFNLHIFGACGYDGVKPL